MIPLQRPLNAFKADAVSGTFLFRCIQQAIFLVEEFAGAAVGDAYNVEVGVGTAFD